MNEELQKRLEELEKTQHRLMGTIVTLEEWLFTVGCKAEVNKRVLLKHECKEEIQDIMDKEEEKIMSEQE